MHARSLATAAGLAVAVGLVAPATEAQPAAAAQALFEQGKAALAGGELETACSRFRASDQLEPAAGTRAYLAACEAWVDEVVDRPRKPFEFLTGMCAPQPSTHPDPRMHLTLGDMPRVEPAWPGGVKQALGGGLRHGDR